MSSGAINSWILRNSGPAWNSLWIEHGPVAQSFQMILLSIHLSLSFASFLSYLLVFLFSFFSLPYFPASLFFPLLFSPPQVSTAMAIGFYTWKSSWLWMETKISQFFSDSRSCQPWKTDRPSSDSLNIKSWVFQLIFRLACQVLLCRALLRGN